MLRRLSELYKLWTPADLDSLGIHLDASAVRRLDKCLPAAIIEGCLEYNLSHHQPTADLWAIIPNDDNGPELTRAFLDQTAGAVGALTPGWREARRLMAAWATPGLSVNRFFGNLFIEFDIEPQRALQPIVLAGLAASIQHDHHKAALVAIEAYQRQMTAQPMTRLARLELNECIDRLPKSAYIRHMALLSGRGKESIRLVITLRAPAVAKTLSDLGWSGDIGAVQSLLTTHHKAAEMVGLQLDVGNIENGKVSIELPPTSLATWSESLGYFAEDGLCQAWQKSAIEKWLAGRSPSQYRALMLKISFEPKTVKRLKAYLCFS